jgi:hypothetical protein
MPAMVGDRPGIEVVNVDTGARENGGWEEAQKAHGKPYFVIILSRFDNIGSERQFIRRGAVGYGSADHSVIRRGKIDRLVLPG